MLSLNGLPPGDFPLPILDVVLRRITVRDSLVGTRQDLEEALTFAAEGKVHAHAHPGRLEDINAIFERLRQGAIEGRIVLNLHSACGCRRECPSRAGAVGTAVSGACALDSSCATAELA